MQAYPPPSLFLWMHRGKKPKLLTILSHFDRIAFVKKTKDNRISVSYNQKKTFFYLTFYDLVLPMTLEQLKQVGNQIETTIESYYREKEKN